MKKWLALAVGLFVISAGSIFASEAKAPSIAFTLAISEGIVDNSSAGISFRLAGKAVITSAGADPSGAGLIEDQIRQFRTAIGWEALFSNIFDGENSGCFNTAAGYQALYSNTYGSFNTATGSSALFSNTEGKGNTAHGSYALYGNILGNFNTAFGYAAIADYTTGSNNTAVGLSALEYIHAGQNNTALGSEAGLVNTNGNFNIYIGAGVKGFPQDSNLIRIGKPYDAATQAGQNQTFISGIWEAPLSTGENLAVVGVNPEGRLGQFPVELLPTKGDPGPQGPQGQAGEGLISGSLLFLVSGTTPPATAYHALGTYDLLLTTPGNKKPTKVTVIVYQKL
jgi:hypothetical protein